MTMEAFLTNEWTPDEYEAPHAAALNSHNGNNAHPPSISSSRNISERDPTLRISDYAKLTVDDLIDTTLGPEFVREESVPRTVNTFYTAPISAPQASQNCDTIPGSSFLGQYTYQASQNSGRSWGSPILAPCNQQTGQSYGSSAVSTWVESSRLHRAPLAAPLGSHRRQQVITGAGEWSSAMQQQLTQLQDVSGYEMIQGTLIALPGTQSGGPLGSSCDGYMTSPDAPKRGRRSDPEASREEAKIRKQRRMIKNRDSAARSRARKQAYTLELEVELMRYAKRNEQLQKEVEESEKRQQELINVLRGGPRKSCACTLRRTRATSW